MADTCQTCSYWAPNPSSHPVCDPGETVSICRRHAPVSVTRGETAKYTDLLNGFGEWPMTVSTGWCGDWRAA